jgi:7-cyano-7-deazaguanine synthase
VESSSAVLFSGGLDSTVLLADELSRGHSVQPIHVRCGLSWESAEARAIDRLLATAPLAGRSAPAVTLWTDMRDIYPPDHWALMGQTPDFDSPDADVYLAGRNLLLLSKAAVLCQQRGINRLLLGCLAVNPFPDATPEFFEAMERAASIGLNHPIKIGAPYLEWPKTDVVRRGNELGVPLAMTLSCINPTVDDHHCGSCSKCRERQEAFWTVEFGPWTREPGKVNRRGKGD